jgi:hypothetical protein
MKPVSASALARPSGFCRPISRKPKMTMKQEMRARIVPSGTPQGSSVSREKAVGPACCAAAWRRRERAARSQAMPATKRASTPMTSAMDQAATGGRVAASAKKAAASGLGGWSIGPSCAVQEEPY